MKKILITLAAIVLIFTACKDEPTCPAPIVVEERVDFIGTFESEIPEREKRTYTFNEDGTYREIQTTYYIYNDPNFPNDTFSDVSSGTWEINSKVQLCEESTTVFVVVDSINGTRYYNGGLRNLSISMSGQDTLNFHGLDADEECTIDRIFTRIK